MYIITNRHHTVLYTGVSSRLEKRLWEHQNKISPESFSSKYRCTKLVYYLWFDSIVDAIAEEKRIKGGNRAQKIALVSAMNPTWSDLGLLL